MVSQSAARRGSMQGTVNSLFIFILLRSFSMSGQLPPDIMADAYLLQAEQAVRDGDFDRGRTVIHKIRTLQNQRELDLEVEFNFRYARVAGALEMSDVGLESVAKYLAAAGREGKHYEAALALMNSAKAGSSRGDFSAKRSPSIIADAKLSEAEQAIQEDNAKVGFSISQDAGFDHQLLPVRDGCFSLSVLRSIPC